MGHRTHDDVAYRWRERALNGQQSAPAYKSANLHDEGDVIYSYGHHFEVGRILRDHRRRPTGWLLNGNTYSNTTSKHQAAVRSAVRGHGLPVVTIPHAALDAAGIELASVQIVDVQRDWSTERVITRTDNPGRKEYENRWEPGGWRNSLTGEVVLRAGYRWDTTVSKPIIECEHMPRPNYWTNGEPWEEYAERKQAYETHIRAAHGEWEEFDGRSINTGRVTVVSGLNGGIRWEIVDDPESPLGYVFERTVHRHWLGASLIRAAVIHQVNRVCPACNGTGIGPERWHYDGLNGEGPLDQGQDIAWHVRDDLVMERNGGIRQYPPRMVETVKRYDDCRGCSRTGRVRRPRRRWAYYLSGFDENETRPSYFFCELPPGVSPTTVEEAYETLKPSAVKLAEQFGREVKRQGDIFAIPLPDTDTRLLKKTGTYQRAPKGLAAIARAGETADVPYLLGTNHAATEVVVIGGQTYARGAMTHAPAWRDPDHKRLALGKTWHLIVKNTVPIAR
jgi:hypothetical protein